MLYRLNENVVITVPTRIKALQVLSLMKSAVAVPWYSDEHGIHMVLQGISKNNSPYVHLFNQKTAVL